MSRVEMAVVAVLGLGLLVSGCSSQPTPELPPAEALDQMPLALVRSLTQAGYELVGYYELDTNDDSLTEVLAVLTVKLPLEQSYLGDSRVVLFGQRGGAWSLNDGQRLDGINANAELRDLNGDGFPELLVFTEEADNQPGDFVTPLHYTDHLNVFTYESNLYLVKLGTFSSNLSGVMRPRTTVGEWGGQPAIQTTRDIPPVGSSLWWPYSVETLAWNGRDGFVSVQIQERRRISPLVSWLARRNAPWTLVFLVSGGVLSWVTIAIVRRSGLRERWFMVGLTLLLVAGGVGLGATVEWVCTPVLILAGLAGLAIGRKMAHTISIPGRKNKKESAE